MQRNHVEPNRRQSEIQRMGGYTLGCPSNGLPSPSKRPTNDVPLQVYSKYHAKQDCFFYSPEMGWLGGFVKLNYDGGLVFLMEGAGIALAPFRRLYDLLDQGTLFKKGKSSVVDMKLRVDGGQLLLYAGGTDEWRALPDCPVLKPREFRL